MSDIYIINISNIAKTDKSGQKMGKSGYSAKAFREHLF